MGRPGNGLRPLGGQRPPGGACDTDLAHRRLAQTLEHARGHHRHGVGRDLEPGLITTPVKTYFTAQEQLAFNVQVPQALQLLLSVWRLEQTPEQLVVVGTGVYAGAEWDLGVGEDTAVATAIRPLAVAADPAGANAVRAVEDATFSATPYSAGDVFEVVVTVSAGTGTLGQGTFAKLVVAEAAA